MFVRPKRYHEVCGLTRFCIICQQLLLPNQHLYAGHCTVTITASKLVPTLSPEYVASISGWRESAIKVKAAETLSDCQTGVCSNV